MRVLTFAFVLLASGLVLAQSQPPLPSKAEFGEPKQGKAQHNAQQVKPKSRGTQELPLVVRIQKPHEEADQDAKEREEKSANDRRLVWFTGFLFFVGVVQAIIFGFQLRAFNKQAAALDNTIGVLKATKEATDSNAERQLRAYVHVESASRFPDRPLDDGVWTFAISFQNYGLTPARDANFLVEVGTVRLPPNPADPYASQSKKTRPVFDFAPRASISTFLPTLTVTKEQISEFKSGKWGIVIIGEFKYTDVFNIKRETKLRMQFTNESLPSDALRYSDEGNKAT